MNMGGNIHFDIIYVSKLSSSIVWLDLNMSDIMHNRHFTMYETVNAHDYEQNAFSFIKGLIDQYRFVYYMYHFITPYAISRIKAQLLFHFSTFNIYIDYIIGQNIKTIKDNK